MVSLTPAPPSDLDSCTLTWEASLSLAAAVPTFPGHWGLARRVALAAGAVAVMAAPPFLPPRAPRLQDHRKATLGCATLA